VTRYGPELNDGKHVFVFGSNLAGWHGRGAALDAKNYWGAVRGVGKGRTGNAYAIPTKNAMLYPFPLPIIAVWVGGFVEYARERPELTFLVTRIGCGLAGYQDKDIAPMFGDAPANCVLPEGWRE
jgi:hypothetical protein